MSLNTVKILSNGETFTRSDYNGVSIIIRDKDSYINATKIANDNNKRDGFKKWIKADKWNEICDVWLNNFSGKNFPEIENKEILPYYKITTTEIGGKIETYGTYIHPDLIHFVAEWCNVEYAFKVSIIMNEINKVKEAKHENGNEYLNNVITKLKDKNNRLRDANKKQKDKIDELLNKVDELNKRNEEILNNTHQIINQNNELKEDNKELKDNVKEQTETIDNLNNEVHNNNRLLKTLHGRITNPDAEKSVPYMIYQKAKISINILHPETLQQEYSISRAQEKYLKNEAKTAYYKGEHISIDYVTIGPQLNRKVIERLLSSDIGKYLTFDKYTTMFINFDKYFTDKHKEKYIKLIALAKNINEYSNSKQENIMANIEKNNKLFNREKIKLEDKVEELKTIFVNEETDIEVIKKNE